MTFRYREFPVLGIFHFFAGIGTGIVKIWYWKKERFFAQESLKLEKVGYFLVPFRKFFWVAPIGLKVLLNSDIFLTLMEGGIGRAIARNVIPFHNCEMTKFTNKLQNEICQRSSDKNGLTLSLAMILVLSVDCFCKAVYFCKLSLKLK